MKAIHTLILSSLLLTACDIKPRALDEHKPTLPGARVQAVSFGFTNADDGGWNVSSDVTTRLPEGAKQAIVWFEWKNAKQGDAVVVRWYSVPSNQLLFETEESLETRAGHTTSSLVRNDEAPLENGSYRVELTEKNEIVAEIPFAIGNPRSRRGSS